MTSLKFHRTRWLAAGSAWRLRSRPSHAATTLLNVSYDPTRELYDEYNKLREALESKDRRGRRRSSSRTAARASRRARSSTACQPTS